MEAKEKYEIQEEEVPKYEEETKEENVSYDDIEIGDAYEIPKEAVLKVTGSVTRTLDLGKVVDFTGEVDGKPISISKARYKSPANGNIVEQGLWVSLKDKKLDYNCGLAVVMRKYKFKKLKDAKGIEMKVVRDQKQGFWIISAI